MIGGKKIIYQAERISLITQIMITFIATLIYIMKKIKKKKNNKIFIL